MKCLLIIDVQKGFVTSCTAHIIPRLCSLLKEVEDCFVVATKFVNQDNSPFDTIMHWGGLKDSPETDLISQIEDAADYILEKSTYTACTTDMLRILGEKNISEVYVAGIDTDACVLKTAIDLFEHGIRPMVLTHYCASTGGVASHDAAITVMKRSIGCRQMDDGVYLRKD